MTKRKELEELARKRGVVLASPASAPAPQPDAGAVPAKPGWMARAMPVAAPIVAALKAQPQLAEFWPGIEANLRRGAGYVIDETTRIAIGSPPVTEWQRGKIEQRDGFTIMRVRRREVAGTTAREGSA